MKPFQLVVVAIFGFLALAGLYVFANFTGGSGGSSIGTVLIWGVLPQAAMQAAIADEAKTNTAYKNVTYVEKDPATLNDDLAQAIATGKGPDLVLASQDLLLPLANKLAVIPYASLPQRTFLNTYEGVFGIYLTQTGTYGVPLVVDPMVLYYDKTLLQDAGVAAPPSAWEQFAGLVPLLTKQTNAQSIQQSTIPFGGYGNVEHAASILSLLILQAGSPVTMMSASGGMRSALVPAGGSAQTAPATAAVRFYTQFADAAKSVYSWNPSLPNSRQFFLAGNLAFYPGFASEVPSLSAANPNLHFDMAPIPQAAAGGVKADYALAYAFMFPSASKNPSGAFTVAEALSASASMSAIAKATHTAPASTALLAPDPADPYQAVFYPEALIAKAWLSPSSATTDAIFAAMINDVTSGRETADNALISAGLSLDAALKNL